MSKGYEERYLITLLSAVLNQTSAPEPIRQLDWDKMYRLADYHRVAHAVYYGIMGLEDNIPQTIRQRFFDKYLEAVYRTDRLRAGEKEVQNLMERVKINCFFLRYADTIQCFPVEEMCCCDSIQVGVDKKSIKLIGSVLEKADFEERNTDGHGCLYYRVPGIRVLCFHQNLFFSNSMRKFYKRLTENLPYKKGSRYIHDILPSDQYLLLICQMTDSYARGEINLGQIVDFWAFYKKYGEKFNWPYIYDKLKKLKIDEFAERLEILILRWFGTEETTEYTEIYEAMESYILSKGTEGRELSSSMLPLINRVADCYARNRKSERLKKMLYWLFPERRYMEMLYPVLERLGFSLPLFWIIRLIRNAIRFIFSISEERIIQPLKKFITKIVYDSLLLKKLASKNADNDRDTADTKNLNETEILSDSEINFGKDKTTDIPK